MRLVRSSTVYIAKH